MSEFILKADVLRVLGDGEIKAYVGTEFEEGREIGRWEAIESIRAMTAVDAKPVVHGRWINLYNAIDPITGEHWRVRCGVCGFFGVSVTNYCHNCGALMDLEDEECD